MKKGNTKTVTLEGANHDAAYVSSLSREAWLKHGKERYYHTVGNSTATPEQQEAVLLKVYELSHEAMGTKPKAVKEEK